jgi:hypothetical protein
MLKKFQTYIEQEPWDEAMLRQERLLNRMIVVVILLAVIYFVTPIVGIFLR